MSADAASSNSEDSSAHSGSPRGQPVHNTDFDAMVDAIERARHPEDEPLRGQFKNSILPQGKLPGFGEPLENCGDFIPESMHFCGDCYDVKQFPRNCYRYDCPEHALHAVRRRAAGSSDGAGIGPQLDGIRRFLNANRGPNQHFHHLTFEPPVDFFWEADDPLERFKDVVRELMDILGVQGVACYHPFKGDHEGDDSDDRGEWQQRLGNRQDWIGDVRDELKPKGHMHVICVAHKVDLEDIGDVYDETGWVIKRITKSEDSNISIEDDEAMARAVTYALSHSMVYETESGQRRLAAWMKGPDVNHVTPTERNKWRMKGIVRSEAETTLDVPAPSFECSNNYRPSERRLSNGDGLPDLERLSQHHDPLDFYRERPAGPQEVPRVQVALAV